MYCGFDGYWRDDKGRLVYRMVAEKALGRPLPPGAVVHHVNGHKWDDRPCNLVICPSHQYHQLLHQRMNERTRKENPRLYEKLKDIPVKERHFIIKGLFGIR